MSTASSIITGVGVAGTAGALLIDWKEKKIHKENAKIVAGVSVALTATAAGAATINDMTLDKIHQKYSSAYIQSMSDEQLEEALIQMDLLLPEEDSKVEEKTI